MPDSWVCSRCQADNFRDRWTCYRCHADYQETLDTPSYEETYQERDLEDNDVFSEEGLEKEKEEEVRNIELSKGGGARKDTNENEETNGQADQLLSGQEDRVGLDPGIGLEEVGEREEGEIIEEVKSLKDAHQADENEKARAEAEAFSIQSREKDPETVGKVSSEEKKTDAQKITGMLVLPDNVYYPLVFPDDERGLYFTDSEGEEEEKEAAATQKEEEAAPAPSITTAGVEQSPKAATEEVHPLSEVSGGE